MSAAKKRGPVATVLIDNLWWNNPIFVQVLGICSTLAVTNNLTNTFIMTVGVSLVTAFSSLTLSAMNKLIPNKVRMIVQVLVISFYVIIVDIVLRAYIPEVSKALGPYVGLIITNCIVLGRTEGFAMQNPPLISMIDGIGNGLGYGIVLVIVGFLRELIGTGKLLGHTVLPTVYEGGWYVPNSMFLLAPAAFFIIGFLIWFLREWKPEQQEQSN